MFNVGTGNGTTVLEILQTFESESGVTLPYHIGPRREGDVVAVYADVAKSNRQLGWVAKRSMREAVADAWRWQQRLGG